VNRFEEVYEEALQEGIMHSTINSLSVGRSVTEALRVLKAFQFSLSPSWPASAPFR